MVAWGGAGVQGWNVTTMGPDGKLAGFRAADLVNPVVALNDGRVFGNMTREQDLLGSTIGLIDVSHGVLTPVQGALVQEPFGDGEHPTGRNNLLSAVTGPFLRISSGINCLPVRVDTDTQAQELTCAADGTLVYDLHNTMTVGAQEWTRVRLLDGREGYAVSRYLTAE